MKKCFSLAVTVWLAAIVVSLAATPDKDAIMAKEKEAWQAFKDKSTDGFKKLVDPDYRGVYAERISTLKDELADMQKWDMKSFALSDYTSFSDEPDVIVTTYKVTITGTYDGKEHGGTFNCGTVWKMEKDVWLAIFHTNVKAESATK